MWLDHVVTQSVHVQEYQLFWRVACNRHGWSCNRSSRSCCAGCMMAIHNLRLLLLALDRQDYKSEPLTVIAGEERAFMPVFELEIKRTMLT